MSQRTGDFDWKPPLQPPQDNNYVAPGCERFPEADGIDWKTGVKGANPTIDYFSPDPRRRLTSLLDGMSSAERKEYPVTTGCFDYFRDALLAVSHVSWCGNQKHNPGEPLHWARGKSTDEEDAMGRHLLERDQIDMLTKEAAAAQLAWRALAHLQKLLEKKYNIMPPPGAQ